MSLKYQPASEPLSGDRPLRCGPADGFDLGLRDLVCGVLVWGLGFKVEGLVSRLQCLGLGMRVERLGFRVGCSGCSVQG